MLQWVCQCSNKAYLKYERIKQHIPLVAQHDTCLYVYVYMSYRSTNAVRYTCPSTAQAAVFLSSSLFHPCCAHVSCSLQVELRARESSVRHTAVALIGPIPVDRATEAREGSGMRGQHQALLLHDRWHMRTGGMRFLPSGAPSKVIKSACVPAHRLRVQRCQTFWHQKQQKQGQWQ